MFDELEELEKMGFVRRELTSSNASYFTLTSKGISAYARS
jgi:predicted transcriptional regulator